MRLDVPKVECLKDAVLALYVRGQVIAINAVQKGGVHRPGELRVPAQNKGCVDAFYVTAADGLYRTRMLVDINDRRTVRQQYAPTGFDVKQFAPLTLER